MSFNRPAGLIRDLLQCTCGHIWNKVTYGERCTNVMCPTTAQQRWDEACGEALVLVADLDADDGSDAVADDLNGRYGQIGTKFSQAGSSDRKVTTKQDPRSAMMAALQSWRERRREHQERIASEQRAVEQLSWNPVIIGCVDVTDHIAAMFDALVASIDWGSGFLDDDVIESILLVGKLAGFKMDGHQFDQWRAQQVAKAQAGGDE